MMLGDLATPSIALFEVPVRQWAAVDGFDLQAASVSK